jgi:hypothetical protein
MLMEPGKLKPGIFAPKGVVHMSDDQRIIQILIMNITDLPVRVGENIHIGQLHLIEPHDVIELLHTDSHTTIDICNVSSTSDQSSNEILHPGITIPDHLTESQQRQLKRLIIAKRALFADDPKKPGTTNRITHRINTGDEFPISLQPYRNSMKENEYIREEVNEMVKKGTVRPSQSPWAAPVILVKKKDGTMRFCVDYRKLNVITKKDNYPLPRVDESLNALGGSKYFSSMDLASGYWQIDMAEGDKEKTAFITRDGLFEFNVMPFGLCNAPATFQRLMDMVMCGLKWKKCLVYFDDILVFTHGSFEQHLIDLAEVMDTLIAADLKAKATKCGFARREVGFLGHLVSTDGIKPDPAKVQVIKEWPPPTTLKNLRSFLGLASYYRRFVKQFATITAPLSALTQKDTPYVWSKQCDNAFNRIKRVLCNSPVVQCPDTSKLFILQTDASQFGIGAVLAQRDHNDPNNEHVIEYASRTLNKAQRNYSTIEKECLAIVWGVKQFRPYLFGAQFVIQSDHKPLQYLHRSKDLNGRLTRWALTLQEYTFTIEYKKGSSNDNADSLSRMMINMVLSDTPFAIQPVGATAEVKSQVELAEHDLQLTTAADIVSDITEQQHQCPQLKVIIDRLKTEPAAPTGVVLDGETLYYIDSGAGNRKVLKRKLAVPQSLRDEILRQMHDDPLSGHLALEKTYSRILDRFWWPNMYSEVKEWCRTCPDCNAHKDAPGRRKHMKPPTLSMPIPSAPFEFIAVDTMDKLPRTANGNTSIVVFMDYLTRWPEAYAIPDSKASTLAMVLVRHIICRHGAPTTLLSDRGPAFLGQLAQSVYKLMNIKKINTTAYHPQTNGLVERMNGSLIRIIKLYVNENQNDWDVYLPFALFCYRTTYHTRIGETPFYLLHGREPRLPIDAMTRNDIEQRYTSGTQFVKDIQQRMKQAHELVKSHLQSIADTRDTAAIEYPSVYKSGDKVFIKFPQVKPGMRKKLSKPWRGPYIVKCQTGIKNYCVINPVDGTKSNRSVDVMKPYLETYDRTTSDREAYEVERVVDKKTIGDAIHYLIKWKGYHERQNTWEPISNLSCDDEIQAFERRRALTNSSSRESSSDVKCSINDANTCSSSESCRDVNCSNSRSVSGSDMNSSGSEDRELKMKAVDRRVTRSRSRESTAAITDVLNNITAALIHSIDQNNIPLGIRKWKTITGFTA